MKIVHHETVKQLVTDPNTPTGLREQVIHQVSDTQAISFPRPKLTKEGNQVKDREGQDVYEYETYERGEDGTFDVPEDVGRYYVQGSTGHPRAGWSMWTGRHPVGTVNDPRVAVLERELAELKKLVTAKK